MNFADLLNLMTQKKASDLFISAGIPPSIKINGRIAPVSKNALSAEQAREVIYRIMSPLQKAEFERSNELNFALNTAENGRFRANVFRQQNQVGMVLRRIETEVPPLDQLHLPEVVRDLAMLRQGIVFIIGGTGSGKSTTMASMVDYRNRHSNGHIICIEDPIEFVHRPAGCIITQREVGVDTDSYSTALKNTLRQAPNLVVIGEIRDGETLSHALQFADTGHLVLTTLHAANSRQALERIVALFPEDKRNQVLMELSLNLRAVVGQRLVPARAEAQYRVATEVLLNTPLVSSLLRKNDIAALKELTEKSEQHGMHTFDQSLLQMVRDQLVSEEDALKFADSANELRLMLKLDKNAPEEISAMLENASLIGNQ